MKFLICQVEGTFEQLSRHTLKSNIGKCVSHLGPSTIVSDERPQVDYWDKYEDNYYWHKFADQ